MKKKIMLVGGEDISLRIPFINKLKSLGYEVVVVGSENRNVFDEKDVEYYKYELNRWLSPIQDINTILKIRAIIRKTKPDVVHGFDTKPAIFTGLAALLIKDVKAGRTINGVGQIFSEDNISNRLLRPIYFILQAISSRISDFTVFQNSEDKGMFERNGFICNRNNHLILSSGVNFDDFPVKGDVSSETKVKKVILISRIIKNKGVLEYLEAAKTLKLKNDNYEFYLVGPISSEGNYAIPNSVIESYDRYVNYLGVRKDVKELLLQSDLFVLPSYYREGVPRVLLEAGSVGLPLISTDMPGCNDVVSDGVNGFLVKPRDASDLANKIEKALMLKSEERERIRDFNIQYIRNNFSLDKVIGDYDKLYESLS